MPRKKAVDGVEIEEVLERFDPETDIEADSDPTFELKLKEDPEDKHVVYVHKDDVGKFKGKRYEALKAGPGVELACGTTFADGEDITYREHIAMACDRAYHERREKIERQKNSALRERMIGRANKTVFVNKQGEPGTRQTR